MTLSLVRGQVWQVTLERPKQANALSSALVEQLHLLLEEAAVARPEALVLRGNPVHFAAGLDLTGLEAETDASLAHRLLRIGTLLERLLQLPLLTIAVVEGAAVGAGADLALACDRRIGTHRASFRFPGSGFGAVLGTARLAAASSAHVALSSSRRRYAEEALRDGLLTDLAEDPEATLAGILRTWRGVTPTARAGLLGQARSFDADAALAALARSVTVPGLRDRVLAFAATARPRAATPPPATPTTHHRRD